MPKMKIKKVGFWRSTQEPKLPRPKIEFISNRKEFEKALEILENYLDNKSSFTGYYKGWSNCRICGERNGSDEFKYKGWIWPSGFYHYIEDHLIGAPTAFIKFIIKEAHSKEVQKFLEPKRLQSKSLLKRHLK